MARRHVNKRHSVKAFRKGARRTKAVNVMHTSMRGGIRL